MTFDELLTRVLPWVPGCPDLVALDHLRQAAREFCVRTEVMTCMGLPVLTSPGIDTYPLDMDDGQERVKLLAVWIGSQRVDVVPTNRGRAMAQSNQQNRTYAYLDGAFDLVVRPAPTQDGLEIVAQMVVKPTLDADELDDSLAEYILDISYGAIASLSMLPEKIATWHDAAQAGVYRGLFNERCAVVGIKASRASPSGCRAREPIPVTFLARYNQGPAETIDYTIDFAKFLASHGADTIASFDCDCDSGLEIESSSLVGTGVVVFVKGGESGRAYRVYAEVTTAGGRVKRGDIQIRVRGPGAVTGRVYDGGTLDDLGDGLDIDGGEV